MKALALTAALAGVAHADPAADVVAHADEPHGLAVGVELGEPAAASVGWFAGALSLTGAMGTGTLSGVGFSAHADAQLVVARLGEAVPVRAGLGARFYDQHYAVMSPDELPDRRWGVRASVAIAYERPSYSLYAEAAPGIDVKRSQTCTLVDGPNSICPHAQSTPLFIQLDVGARFFLSH